MEKVTRDAISKMSSTLSTRAQKFNGEFFLFIDLVNAHFEAYKVKESRMCNIWVHKNLLLNGGKMWGKIYSEVVLDDFK